MKSLTRNGKFLNYFPLFISLKMIIIKRTRFIDEEIYIMNKVSKGLVLALAGIRSLLIQDLQNGVYGTLADNDLKKLSEKDIQKGCPTTVYLNGKVIGHTAKNDNHHIIWDK